MNKNFKPTGIVDIGSNSIRLVVYGGMADAGHPLFLFEDKAICQLAKGLAKTGRLAKGRIELALQAFQRFRLKLDILKIKRLVVIATSAVREAKNGAAFVKQVEAILQVPVSVISGDEEARLSSLGVSFSFADAEGIVADLGGGSLELAELCGQSVGNTVSFTLGHQRLLELWEANQHDLNVISQHIAESLNTVKWLGKGRQKSLYLVGSAFRRLGKRYLASIEKSDVNVNGLTLRGRHVNKLIQALISGIDHLQPEDWLMEPKAELKVVMGALILRQLIQLQHPSQVVICATGVREGVLLQYV